MSSLIWICAAVNIVRCRKFERQFDPMGRKAPDEAEADEPRLAPRQGRPQGQNKAGASHESGKIARKMPFFAAPRQEKRDPDEFQRHDGKNEISCVAADNQSVKHHDAARTDG